MISNIRRICPYQSSPQPSSFVFFCGPDEDFFIALVPRLPPGLDAPPAPPPAPKLSQKSLRSGSPPLAAAARLACSSWPSTNLVKVSAAPFAPVWTVLPATSAACRAWAAKSVDAIYHTPSVPGTSRERIVQYTYSLSRRLDIRVVHDLGLLSNCSAEPAESLR